MQCRKEREKYHGLGYSSNRLILKSILLLFSYFFRSLSVSDVDNQFGRVLSNDNFSKQRFRCLFLVVDLHSEIFHTGNSSSTISFFPVTFLCSMNCISLNLLTFLIMCKNVLEHSSFYSILNFLFFPLEKGETAYL